MLALIVNNTAMAEKINFIVLNFEKRIYEGVRKKDLPLVYLEKVYEKKKG
ncbi:MAG TPA: hypothetical protein VK173_12110 [Lacibacter sp.]|nr:hypothetical protein [Lacibacter sp.]